MEWMSNTDLNTLMQDRVRARIRLTQLMEDMAENPESAKTQLYKYLQGHFVPCCYEIIPNFAGVFAADKMPPHTEKDCMFIFNTDPSNKPGEHWLAYRQRHGQGEWFDSLGRSPHHYSHLQDWLKSSPRPIAWSNRRIQGPNGLCGDYCVYFLCERPLSPQGTIANFLFDRPRFRSMTPADASLTSKDELKSILGFNDASVVSYMKHNMSLLKK